MVVEPNHNRLNELSLVEEPQTTAITSHKRPTETGGRKPLLVGMLVVMGTATFEEA